MSWRGVGLQYKSEILRVLCPDKTLELLWRLSLNNIVHKVRSILIPLGAKVSEIYIVYCIL